MTQDFNGFGLPAKLLQAIARMQFTVPTPVQAQAIPLGMQGRDILASAQTGTGKTGAFGIPLIAKLLENETQCAIVMTPTRELAAQVMATLQQMIPTTTIRTALLIGGESMPRQFRQLDARPRLIIGTPGRINDHLARGTLKLKNTSFLVLDEADRMLDMGFGVQLEKIFAHLPAVRQTMMFSATMPASIVKLSQKYLNNPERITVGSTITPAANIKQELVETNETDKYKTLLEQLKKRTGSVIIFVKTKYGTERLAVKLVKEGQEADAIHGDLQQKKRDRVIQSFRDKKYRILVATDVAARGLDIPHIEHVINYDLPQCPEDYIHRIGRTARAGAVGSACNLLTPADRDKWRAINRLMNGEEAEPMRKGGKGRGAPRGNGGGYGGGGKSRFQRGPTTAGGRFANSNDAPRRDEKPAARADGTFEAQPRSENRPRRDADFEARPARSDKPRREGSYAGRQRREGDTEKQGNWTPHFRGAEGGERPAGDRPARTEGRRFDGPRSDRPRTDRPAGERKFGDRKFGDRPRGDRPVGDRKVSDRPVSDRPAGDRPRADRPAGERPAGHGPEGKRSGLRGAPNKGGFGGQRREGQRSGAGGRSFAGRSGGGQKRAAS